MAQKKTKKTYSMPEKQRLLCRWTFELAAFLQEEHNMDKKAALELAHLNRELILHLGSGRVYRDVHLLGLGEGRLPHIQGLKPHQD